ncbi:MAG: S41 family peptidase, partial [Stellaceae bacterium]
YYTPSGRSIQAEGIEPDILVEAAKIETPPAKPGTKVAAVPAAKSDSADDDSDASSTVDPSIMGKPADYQMMRAADMLRGMSLFSSRMAVN